jgi:hypothetical protein
MTQLAIEVDGADLVLAGQLRKHGGDDLLDIVLVVPEIVE